MVSTIDLVRVRAALAVGVAPAHALADVTDPELAGLARQIQVGLTIGDAAKTVDDRHGPLGAGPVLRCLALAERCGHDAVAALDLALTARQDALIDQQRVAARSAQAVGTARLLAILPVAAWALLMFADPGALAFYGHPLGAASALVVVALAVAARRWSARLVRRAERAAASADPLAGTDHPFDRVRALTVATPVLIATAVTIGPFAAMFAGAVAAAWAGRPRTSVETPSCDTPELLTLLRMLLQSGTPLAAALDHLASVTTAPTDAHLRTVARHLRTGAPVASAFAEGQLDDVGAVLAVTERWGVPAADPLARLADAVRASQRAAAETAAERVQLALVFPTTLLTLPAFVIAIVPPLVWTAMAA